MPKTTKIFLCSGVKVTPEHQYYTLDNTARYNYFNSKSAPNLRFENQSFQRWDSGKCRLECDIDDVSMCNYIMFQNPDYSARWYYAYIDSFQYVSDSAVDVFYTIDIWQTWIFQGCTWGQCYINRMHTPTDVVGEHTLPEPVPAGEMEASHYVKTGLFDQNYIALMSTIDLTQLPNIIEFPGVLTNGVYSSAAVFVYATAEQVNGVLQQLNSAGKLDSILAMYVLPDNVLLAATGTPFGDVEFTTVKYTTTLGSYTPKCKKLLAYPYNYLKISVPGVYEGVFPYEFFDNSQIVFKMGATQFSPPEAVFIPQNYKGATSNTDESFSISGWPMCAYTSDAYLSYMAQNYNSIKSQQASMAINATMQGIASAVQAVTNPVGAISGIVQTGVGYAQQAMQMEASFKDLQNRAPVSHGSLSTSAVFQSGIMDVYTMQYHVRPEYAQVVDNYLWAYGYRVDIIDTPNFNARPYWTYIKTHRSNCSGDAPASVLRAAESALNSGLTFWTNADNIGNYSLQNYPD